MAGPSLIDVRIRSVGTEFAKARLAEVNRSVVPVLRGALNTTATKTRAERYVKPLNKTFAGARTRKGMKVKRANTRYMNSRLIPSSAGVEVPEYKTWGIEPIDATRARIWVLGPKGRKIAAGFVNPSSKGRKPLSTRSSKTTRNKTYAYSRPVQTAQGPSIAFWFKALTDSATVRWVNIFLQQEFERRIKKEVAKGIR